MTDYPDLRELKRARNEKMAADYAAGVDLDLIAQQSGCSAGYVKSIVAAFGVRRPPGSPTGYHRYTPTDRDRAICADYLSGNSLGVCASPYGITRERVRQILNLNGVSERHNGFNSERNTAARAKKLSAMERRNARKAERLARQQRIRDLYNSGLTYSEIVEATGQGLALVQKDVWATGGPDRNAMAGKARQPLTVQDRENILQLYARNVSLPAIGKEFGLCAESVANIVRLHGGQRTRREGALS